MNSPVVSVEAVAAALQAAASRNYQQAQAAANQLEEWHRHRGFHTALQDIYLEQQAPPELRLVALTQLKNGVEKHWKKGANYALTQEEQSHIRQRLFQDIFQNAQNTRFAPFQAIIIAKIARNDFPDSWPSLFQDLVSLLDNPQCTDQTKQTLVLTITRHVIKEFSSVRMTKPRQAFYEAAPALMQELAGRCAHLLGQFINDPNTNVAQGLQAVNFLKCIRRLAVFGYPAPHRDNTVQEIWTNSFRTQQGLLDFILNHRLVGHFAETFPLLTSQFTKLHSTMSTLHPISFSLFRVTPDIARLYWQTACAMQLLYLGNNGRVDGITAKEKYAEDRDFISSFEHKALTLLRSCFKIAYGTLPTLKFRATEEEKREPEDAKRVIKEQLLTPDFVRAMIPSLIQSFLIYDNTSLQQWEDEPEEWEASQSEQDDSFDVSPRHCADRVLMDIALYYKDMAVPLLIQLVDQSASSSFADKESVYSALGATAAMVDKAFDFNSFLTARLLEDLRLQGPGHALLLYRAPILLAQWTPINIADQNKGLVYSIFAELLRNDDLVIRIAAAKRFRDICNDFGFSADAFVPHAQGIFTSIVGIFDSVSVPETVLALLETMGAMIERMEQQILPFADTLIQLLGPLWQKLEKEQQMKKAVVNVLAKLVNALGSQAAPIQPIVLPMIQGALEPGSQTQLYLLEDALELLHNLVDHSKEPTKELLQLVPLLIPILELESNLAQKALDLLSIYLLLDPGTMLHTELRQPVLQALAPLLSARSNDLVRGAVEYIETAIFQSRPLEQGLQMLLSDLNDMAILPRMLQSLNDCWAAHQTTGPNRKEAPQDARNETFYFTVLSRLIIADYNAFLSVLTIVAQRQGYDARQLLGNLLDEWYSHLDNVSLPGTRKAMVIALSTLLRANSEVILVRMQQLMSAWTSLLIELRDPVEDPMSDSMVVPDSAKEIWAQDSEHWKRRKRLSYADVVHSTSLPDFVRQTMSQAISEAGGEDAFRNQWLVNIDKEVLNDFQALGIF